MSKPPHAKYSLRSRSVIRYIRLKQHTPQNICLIGIRSGYIDCGCDEFAADKHSSVDEESPPSAKLSGLELAAQVNCLPEQGVGIWLPGSITLSNRLGVQRVDRT